MGIKTISQWKQKCVKLYCLYFPFHLHYFLPSSSWWLFGLRLSWINNIIVQDYTGSYAISITMVSQYLVRCNFYKNDELQNIPILYHWMNPLQIITKLSQWYMTLLCTTVISSFKSDLKLGQKPHSNQKFST